MFIDRIPILLGSDREADEISVRRAFEECHIPNPLLAFRDETSLMEALKGGGERPARGPFEPGLLLLAFEDQPERNLDMVNWIRSEPSVRKIPLVCFSPSKDTQIINRAYEVGINSYIVKPRTERDWVEVIRVTYQYWMKLNQRPEG